ncbi:hypothetical protein ACP70R_027448 [Stipagrostis hirtigluma subsp. patula]
MSNERNEWLEDLDRRQAKCRQDYAIIKKQFPVLKEKLDALHPPKPNKRQKRSAKNSEAGSSSASPRVTLSAEQKARYEELAVIIRGFLKELGDDVEEEEAAAGGSDEQPPGSNEQAEEPAGSEQAADEQPAAPPAVEDN